jgi:hypothetical protein
VRQKLLELLPGVDLIHRVTHHDQICHRRSIETKFFEQNQEALDFPPVSREVQSVHSGCNYLDLASQQFCGSGKKQQRGVVNPSQPCVGHQCNLVAGDDCFTHQFNDCVVKFLEDFTVSFSDSIEVILTSGQESTRRE